MGCRLPRRSGRPVRATGIVLYYHAVKSHQRRRFAWQLDELLKRAVPFPADLPESMRPGTRNVAVTFDDGFRSVVDNALPELAQRGIPFTVFVPSGCLGERPSWVRNPEHPSWDERVLSGEELRALVAAPLVTIGSHSITHPNLTTLNRAQSEQELAGSKAQLEAAAGVTIDLFSFPHGAHSGALIDQALRIGYRRVFTVEPTIIDSDADAIDIGRVAADPGDWAVEFRLKLAGAYRWRHYFHRARMAA